MLSGRDTAESETAFPCSAEGSGFVTLKSCVRETKVMVSSWICLV